MRSKPARDDARYNPVIMSTAADLVEDFIARWQGVTASELATAQSFVIGLCRLLDLPEPHATADQDYMFERPVSFRHGDGSSSPGRIDCYKRGAFVLEAKKLKVKSEVGAGGTANSTPLTAKEKAIHEKGLVAVLKSLHDELDAAVLDAYGWHDQSSDETLLERLVALNAERAAEEAQGRIRWLRPEFQNPQAAQTSMAGLGDSGWRNQKSDGATSPPVTPAPPQQWPPTLPDQLAAIARILTDAATLQTETQLAANFTGKGRWKSRLPGILEALAALGRARRLDDGRWMG